jgi:hypothetical protein
LLERIKRQIAEALAGALPSSALAKGLLRNN